MGKYKCDNSFLVRIPYNSIDDYYSNFNDNIENYVKNFFKENLLISSNSLYYELINNSKTKKVEKALIKYGIRSSIRTTPYGLNSAILKGEFDKNDNVKINTSSFTKGVRPDMEWLVKIVKMVEDKYFDNIYVTTNNIIKINDFKITKFWNSAYIRNDEELNNIISINNTKAIKYIFECCKEYIAVKDLKELLEKKYPKIKKEIIDSMLRRLVENEFLTTNLRIPIQHTNPFNEIIDFLKEYVGQDQFVRKLLNIKKLIENYKNINISNGEITYKEITKFMSDLVKADNYLQVDMYLKDNIITLDDDKKKDIEDFSELIDSFLIPYTYKEFIYKFQEKYGNVAVKYLDVIDEEIGIGIPFRDNDNINDYHLRFLESIIGQINIKSDCYLDFSTVNFEKKDKEKVISNSRELAFYVFNENGKKKYYCSPVYGSDYQGNLSGRFKYLYSNEEIKLNESNLIDISFIPQISRHANVAIYQSNNKRYLEFGVKSYKSEYQSIDINDIYITVNNDQIVFIYGKTNEIVEFNMPNMLNDTFYPDKIKPLVDINFISNFRLSA